MKLIRTSGTEKAFTLPEVALAVGVVAFGLVAVFSILPFGLTAQKDNREETIIRYEAQYWREFLMAGGLMLDDVERVDRVEVYEPQDLNGTRDPKRSPSFSHVFYNPYRSVPDQQNPGRTLLGHRLDHAAGVKAWYSYAGISLDKARLFWPTDVAGWLMIPVADAAFLDNGNWGNFALVKALNGSLFDRLYGAEPRTTEFHLPSREFAMGYILQVQPEALPNGARIKLTFHWPIFEEVSMALSRGEMLKDIVASSRTGGALVKSGLVIPRFQSKEFSLHTEGALVPALLESNLTLQERRFMKELRGKRIGEQLDPRFIQNRFAPYFSGRHMFGADSVPRRFFNNTVTYGIELRIGNSWMEQSGYPSAKADPSFYPDKVFLDPSFLSFPLGHSGHWLRGGASAPVQIAWVGPDQLPVFGEGDSVKGPYSLILDPRRLPYFNNSGAYEVNLLGPSVSLGAGETWDEFIGKLAKPANSRPALVRMAGGRVILAREMRLTTHRPAAPDEKALNQARRAGQPLVQSWEGVPDEVGAPRLWEVVQ